MITATTEITKPSDTQIVMTRRIPAPRELVFKAWTDPALLARWWGPHGFTNPVCELDVRPGGTYRIVMRSPEGVDYPVVGEYREVIEPELLVYTDTFDAMPEEWLDQMRSHLPPGEQGRIPPIIVTVTFEPRDGGTLLTLDSQLASRALRDAVLQMGAADGWSQSFERLEALMAEMTT